MHGGVSRGEWQQGDLQRVDQVSCTAIADWVARTGQLFRHDTSPVEIVSGLLLVLLSPLVEHFGRSGVRLLLGQEFLPQLSFGSGLFK